MEQKYIVTNDIESNHCHQLDLSAIQVALPLHEESDVYTRHVTICGESGVYRKTNRY